MTRDTPTQMFPNLTDEIRQPEYVGENRCLPCTVVNLGIAAVAAVLTAALLAASGVSIGGRITGGGLVLAGSVATVYLRGYLMPGTPTLTKRYLPLWALRLFGKATDPERDETGDIDVEAVLFDAGALEECPDRDGAYSLLEQTKRSQGTPPAFLIVLVLGYAASL